MTTGLVIGEAPFGVIVTVLFALVAIKVNQTSFPAAPVSQAFVELSLVAFKLEELTQILPADGNAIAKALEQASFDGACAHIPIDSK